MWRVSTAIDASVLESSLLGQPIIIKQITEMWQWQKELRMEDQADLIGVGTMNGTICNGKELA